VIAPALWELGVRQIDHLVLSHADADHYSGLIDLIDRFRIGVVHIPPEFASDRNPQAQRLMAECRGRVVVEELTEGTTLALGGGMKVEVLNPPMVVSAAEPDNSRSLVLDVSADGRHMLLTGDLEGEGLRRLLARPQRPIDVLLAPHHGGLSSNPTSLYAWANAACVVASQKRPLPGARDALRTIEEQGLLVARTWRDGAVRVDWRPDGLRVTHHQKRISTWRLRLDSEVGKLAFTTALALQANRWFALCAAGVLGIGGVVAGVLLAVLEWGAWALVSPSARFAASEAAGVSEPLWQAVEIKAADGAMLRGRWHGGEVGQRSAVAVMLVHGFAEDGSAMLDRAERLREKGYGTLVIDSRARGRSGGEFCTFGAREACDILLWLDFLAAHLGTDAAFVLWGRSMGASIVLNAAQRQTRVAGLILEAPYASLVESVARGLRRKHLPGWLAGGMIARAERIAKSKFMDLNPVNFARQTSLPVLMLLGERDVIAPREQADLIAHALAGPVEVFVSGSANHNQVFQANEQEVSERVLHFVERCTGVLG
jgi:beta-lactamase superfamily II metal-dependent hydrolase/alpha-beta hydrolase superfamily lysophospholipase